MAFLVCFLHCTTILGYPRGDVRRNVNGFGCVGGDLGGFGRGWIWGAWVGEHLVHVGVPALDWPFAAPFRPLLGVGEDERFWGGEMGPKLTFARCFTPDVETFFSIPPLGIGLYP